MTSILYINNGAGLSDVLSGGTARHIETAKVVKKELEINVLTTVGGSNNYKLNNLKFSNEYIVKSHLWKKAEANNFDRMFGYFISTLYSIWLILNKKIKKTDLVYSTSDYFCDVIPAVLFKKVYKVKMVSMVHHRAKNPFRRSGSFLLNALSFVFQRFSFLLIKNNADLLFVYDTPEGEEIAKEVRAKKYKKVKNGIKLDLINETTTTEKTYDICFAGGLRETKGIYDLIPIAEKLENVKIAVCGGGTEEVTQDFRNRIKQKSLEDKFELLGPLDQKTLYKTVKASKVFLSTSHEEGWGISVLEAIALGVPVVAFDLPAFTYLGDTINTVEIFDYNSASQEIDSLLEDDTKRIEFEKIGFNFAKNYSWKEIGNEELAFLKQI